MLLRQHAYAMLYDINMHVLVLHMHDFSKKHRQKVSLA